MPQILLTRPTPRAQSFAKDLQKALPNAHIIYAPLFRAVFLNPPLPYFDTAIFTSQFGIESAIHLGVTGERRNAFCTGAKTAALAQDIGFDVKDIQPTAHALIKSIRALPNASQHILHFSGDISAFDTLPISPKKEIAYQKIQTYKMEKMDWPKTLSDDFFSKPIPVFLPVFSARGAQRLAEITPKTAENLYLIAISQNVSSQLSSMPFINRMVAKSPDRQGMLAALSNAVAQVQT